MSEYRAQVIWERDAQAFVDNQYSRAHTWRFDGGIDVAASASPQVVPAPLSVETNVDPEEAFVASLASCHMLFFLSIAAKKNWVVDSYLDDARGFLEKDARGRMSMTRVQLFPRVTFSGATQPDRAALEKAHTQAHRLCFIANSVRTQIDIRVG